MTALQAPPLENTANNLSPDSRRRLRYERRAVLWQVSNLQRIRHCGRVPRSKNDGVTLRHIEGMAGLAGLQHCGSVWADPVCAGRILVHRALEIGAVLGRAIEQGYSLAFVTLTMQHRITQPLDLLWAAGQKGWQRSISGKYWTKVQHLVEGWVRVWEVTYGANGWHLHVHCVMVLAPGAGADELEQVAGGMFDRWSRGLVAAGLDAPRRIGQDWHIVTGANASEKLGEYLSKLADPAPAPDSAALGLELTHSMPGRSAKSLATRPTWALLDELVATGDADSLDRWHEWERVSKGKRQVGWSKGLRERFAPDVEVLTDDDVVQQEVGTDHDDIVRWSGEQWRAFVAEPDRIVMLLEVTERAGRPGAVALLDHWGVEYELV